ncbi:TIGR02444 family protein [Neptuniibacter sp. PT34_22]|uniref:TIGR02444 family protein n=2 Tax=unclassified Neptuniibacter TaxID=2630693 RepID=UPI0039F48A65
MAADFNIEMQLKNDLWDFALNFYQQPGIEQSCLELQNEFGLSINRLIFACWGGIQGYVLESITCNEADHWQQEMTHPLRGIRYKVRERKQQGAEYDACYQKLRQAELACEQVELALLYQQGLQAAQMQPSIEIIEENLHSYLKSQKVPIDKDILGALKPLLRAANSYLGTNHKE